MNEEEGVNIESLGDELHKDVLELVELLMPLDPEAGTPLGNLLIGLADALIKYEKGKVSDFFEAQNIKEREKDA